MASLTGKQQRFIEEYLKDFNAGGAAKRAGYSGSMNTLYKTGHDNLRNPKIDKIVKKKMKHLAMGTNEALARIAQIARADHVQGIQDGKVSLTRLENLGLLHLVKSITPTKYGDRIEFYDMQSAITTILKAQGAFLPGDINPDSPQVDIIVRNVSSSE